MTTHQMWDVVNYLRSIGPDPQPPADSVCMKIVVADTLPASALELLQADGWTVDARSGRSPDVLAGDLADADALAGAERHQSRRAACWRPRRG